MSIRVDSSEKTIVAAAVIAGLTGCGSGPGGDVPADWDAFWKSVDVSPVPPRNFLDTLPPQRIERTNEKPGQIRQDLAGFIPLEQR